MFPPPASPPLLALFSRLVLSPCSPIWFFTRGEVLAGQENKGRSSAFSSSSSPWTGLPISLLSSVHECLLRPLGSKPLYTLRDIRTPRGPCTQHVVPPSCPAGRHPTLTAPSHTKQTPDRAITHTRTHTHKYAHGKRGTRGARAWSQERVASHNTRPASHSVTPPLSSPSLTTHARARARGRRSESRQRRSASLGGRASRAGSAPAPPAFPGRPVSVSLTTHTTALKGGR